MTEMLDTFEKKEEDKKQHASSDNKELPLNASISPEGTEKDIV